MIPSNYFGEIPAAGRSGRGTGGAGRTVNAAATGSYTCLLYTSDAADEL